MADLTAEAIDRIVELDRIPMEVVMDGNASIVYVPKGYTAQKADAFRTLPQPTPIHLATLTGLRDYVKSNLDTLEVATLTAHVVSPTKVTLFGPVHGPVKQRDVYVGVDCAALAGPLSFTFGTFYDLESFNIALQALFVDDAGRAAVLKLVGSVKAEDVRTVDDNGITQAVTAKAGIALVQEMRAPNPVYLSPYRTFREIEQPASLFILRLQKGRDGELPRAALFEADGGRWKLEACQAIKVWLDSELYLHGRITVLA